MGAWRDPPGVTDDDVELLYSFGCAVAIDLDQGIPRRAALDRYVADVLSRLDADRVRIAALAKLARRNVAADGDHAWREAALIAETALARLGGEFGESISPR
jgi:hypothetical protein